MFLFLTQSPTDELERRFRNTCSINLSKITAALVQSSLLPRGGPLDGAQGADYLGFLFYLITWQSIGVQRSMVQQFYSVLESMIQSHAFPPMAENTTPSAIHRLANYDEDTETDLMMRPTDLTYPDKGSKIYAIVRKLTDDEIKPSERDLLKEETKKFKARLSTA
ncbi:hypothetical protein B7494_g1294 [Chlorociboria aeruginascens]|nr:hypothetical protein B7494_g1294 [Chlorociboria aeruginascens]